MTPIQVSQASGQTIKQEPSDSTNQIVRFCHLLNMSSIYLFSISYKIDKRQHHHKCQFWSDYPCKYTTSKWSDWPTDISSYMASI